MADKTTTTEKSNNPFADIKLPTGKYTYATGKRKSAVAKVRLYKGEGEIMVNGKEAKDYFCLKSRMPIVREPLKLTGNNKAFGIFAKISGGGLNAQAEALRHGISRALAEMEEANKTTLKKAGFLTRDSRVKERKKFGLKRARKAPQFSKR
jgi:small subunit ribosomal protein S9